MGGAGERKGGVKIDRTGREKRVVMSDGTRNDANANVNDGLEGFNDWGNGLGCNDKLNTEIEHKINGCLWGCALRPFGIALLF